MHSLRRTHQLIIMLIIVALFACEQYKWSNPLDPNASTIASSWQVKNFSVIPLNDHSATLVWEENDKRIEGYRIFRTQGSGEQREHAVLGTETQFIDAGLLVDSVYTYQVRAFAGENLGGASPMVEISTVFPALTIIQTTALNDSVIKLDWAYRDGYLAQYDVDGFLLERQGESPEFQIVDTIGYEHTSYFDTGLAEGVFYQYRLSAYNTVNQSAVITSGSSTRTILAPTELQVSLVDDQSILLIWNDRDDQEKGYIIERNDGQATIQVASLGGQTTTFLDVGLIYGTAYQYSVYCFTDNSESDRTSMAEPLLLMAPIPDLVESIAINDQSIRITWQDNCNFEDGYRIYRDDGGGWLHIQDFAANTVSLTDVGLSYLLSYRYLIIPFTMDNEGEGLEVVQNTIAPNPQNLVVNPTDQHVNYLTWDDMSIAETEVRIERDRGDGFVLIAQLDANTHYYLDRDVDNDTSNYVYVVKAFIPSQGEFPSELYTLINVMTDYDGNHYKVRKVGDRYWTESNLRVTHHTNGDDVALVTDNDTWINATYATYSYYDNEPDNAEVLGHMYNWYAVTDSRGIAPEGWHVATFEEFREAYDSHQELFPEYVGLLLYQCGGLRGHDGSFVDRGNGAYYWCSESEYTSGFTIYCSSRKIYPGRWNSNPNWGLYLRCVKDDE